MCGEGIFIDIVLAPHHASALQWVCNSCGGLAVTPDSYKAAASHSLHSLAIKRMAILQAVFQAGLLFCLAPLNLECQPYSRH